MALHAADRVLTIVVTATLTSAFWIAAGGSLRELAREQSGVAPAPTRAAALMTSPTPVAPEAPSGALIIPVAGVQPKDLTDTFTASRGGGTRVHQALDIMAPEGTPVIAAAPGTVEKLFLSDKGGRTIYVRSPDRRMIYYYAHLRDYDPAVKEGQPVTRGERLGAVGHTGDASPDGPHLHFELMQTTPAAHWWDPATPVNPYPILAGKK